MSWFEVVEPGTLTLVQDQGRSGFAHLGVSASGAMDRAALALANRLVGNDGQVAGLEILFGGLVMRARGDLWIAVAGAWGNVTVNEREISMHTATRISAGETIAFPAARSGIRYYLAVRGGVDVPSILGSRSRDTLANLGPSPLRAGDVVTLGNDPGEPIPIVDVIPFDAPSHATVTLEIRPGPRRDWFSPGSWGSLVDSHWRVSPRSDRSGVRLEGAHLIRTELRELPSEGMLPGAIQISPDGAPTILAADHPVTGGYPVIAVVTNESLDSLAQLRPGQLIRFQLAIGKT